MSSFEGQLRMSGDDQPPLIVEVDLTGDHMLLTAGEMEIADWEVEDLRVSALEDGFHITAEGEDVILEVADDARFAVELGLKNAHPALRKRMSQLIRGDD